MTVQLLTDVLIGLAIVGFLMWRQLRWRTFDPAKALRLPIVLAAIGLLELSHLGAASITTTDLLLLMVELALSVGIGAAMGRLTVFRADPLQPHALQARTGGLGAALWIVLIGVRVGIDALGTSMGAHLLTSTGVILLLLAASRATSAVVARARSPHAAAVGMIRA